MTSLPEPILPDGHYPFVDQRYPLAELAMIEVPEALRSLLVAQAEKSDGITRGEPVEVRCVTEGFGEATFLIWWPHGHPIDMLAPAHFRKGNA